MKYLTIRQHIYSPRHLMEIHDDRRNILYQTYCEQSMTFNVWHVMKDYCPVLTFRRKIFANAATWHVSGNMQEYLVKRKFWSLTPRYQVLDGPFEGCEVTGNIVDRTLKFYYQGRVMATADDPSLNLPDKYQLSVYRHDEQALLFMSLMLVVVHIEAFILYKRPQPRKTAKKASWI
ncbi:hypothetical protein [Alteromonas antoniana]|uniref:hypothetical protein n=1 Tax=Alteromonas antoniana TaxID=2803813 RepID=UPI001C48C058|nr:hypothetical protein [Alteromonas antoniana]